MVAVVRLPGQPPILDGFLNLRGSLIPTVRLHKVMAAPEAPFELYTPLLVVRVGERAIALCVDRVVSVDELEDSTRRDVPAQFSTNDCAEAEYGSGDGRFVLLRVNRIFLSEEVRRLEELSREANRRIAELEASRA